MTFVPITGGCLCGALRYEARAEPTMVGLCFCADCRKASGSAFIPFMGFPADVLSFAGKTRQHRSPSLRGQAVRNFCAACGGLVFGGIVGEDEDHTIYAGSLDDPSRFAPAVAIFTRDLPEWLPLPQGLRRFESMPGA
jgi:hypothetical protein